MGQCPITLDPPVKSGQGLKWQINPPGYIYQHDCTRRIVIVGADGTEHEVTGATTYGDFRVDGLGADWLTINPEPTEPGTLTFIVHCPGPPPCDSTLLTHIGPGKSTSVLDKIGQKFALLFIAPWYVVGGLLVQGFYWLFGWLFVLLAWPFVKGKSLWDLLKGWVTDGVKFWESFWENLKKGWNLFWSW